MRIVKIYDLSRQNWEDLIDQWIFSIRDRNIIKKALLDGISIADIANEEHYSYCTVYKIVRNGEKELLKHINL